jgi:biotin transport system substrate-specific component
VNARAPGVTLSAGSRQAHAAARRAIVGPAARELALILAASLFLALAARIRVPLPFTPVPVTGQTLGVVLTGALYGPRRGVLAILAYLAEGAAGVPVFAGGNSGLLVLLGPTGGYLFGFVPAAAIAGLLSRGPGRAWRRLAGALAATAVVYVVGVPWLAVVGGLTTPAAIASGLLPFLPGDVFKAGIAAGATPAGASLLARLGVRPR